MSAHCSPGARIRSPSVGETNGIKAEALVSETPHHPVVLCRGKGGVLPWDS